MPSMTATGPGWFEAFKTSNGAWVPNYGGTLLTGSEGPRRSPARTDLMNVWVQAYETVAQACARVGLPAKVSPPGDAGWAPAPGKTGTFRPYVEGLTKDQVIAFLNEGAAELIRRDLKEKEKEDSEARTKAWELEAKRKREALQAVELKRLDELNLNAARQQKERLYGAMHGLSNFMTGALHALSCQRQLLYATVGDPNGTPKLPHPPGSIWTALELAQAGAKYQTRRVRGKSQDPEDAKPPWERTAVNNLLYGLRKRRLDGWKNQPAPLWAKEKTPPVKAVSPWSRFDSFGRVT